MQWSPMFTRALVLVVATGIWNVFAFTTSVPLRPHSSTSSSNSRLEFRRANDPLGSDLGLGENLALTYLKTGSHCLDLFFQVQPHTQPRELRKRLERAWAEDPAVTLKLIFQLGDPRGGKGDKENFHRALYWLYETQPDSLMENLEKIPTFSYYKSVLDLVQMAIEGPDIHIDQRVRKSWGERRKQRSITHWKNVQNFIGNLPRNVTSQSNWTADTVYTEGFGWVDDSLRKQFVAFIHEEDQKESKAAAQARREKRQARKEATFALYESDERFRRLYDATADLFASELVKERAQVEDNNVKSVSGLAAKWAPSLKSSHDRRTNIVDGIVKRLFPDESDADMDELRDRYRREYLSPIRRAAKIPESFTGSGEWSLVDYKRMPSRCRLLYGESVFRKHDQVRYDAYLDEAKQQAKEGKRVKMVTAGALLPHELTSRAFALLISDKEQRTQDELGLQWLRLVQDVKEKGQLPSSALAVCDVSGSMHGTPMQVAIALSLLIGDIAEGDFANKVITFSERPCLVTVPKAEIQNLGERAYDVQGIDWGYNTDFQKVFELLLETALAKGIPQEQMPSMLFCFSDMEFDCAHNGDWKTDLEQLQEKYQVAGYDVPHLVFWNLRDSRSAPCDFQTKGVTMLSGFSAGLVKTFLEFRLQDATPLSQLLRALEPYDCIVLPDSVESTGGEITDLLKREKERAARLQRQGNSFDLVQSIRELLLRMEQSIKKTWWRIK